MAIIAPVCIKIMETLGAIIITAIVTAIITIGLPGVTITMTFTKSKTITTCLTMIFSPNNILKK